MVAPLSPQPANNASPPSPPTKTSGTQKGKPASAPQQQPAPVPAPVSSVKSKKDSSKTSTATPTMPAKPNPKPQPAQDTAKKVSRRGSKPIINWFQRKLAGTVRARRASESQRYGTMPQRSGKDKQHRRTSAPVPPPLTIQSRTRSNNGGSRHNGSHSHVPSTRRGTISLNESADGAESTSYTTDSDDEGRSSAARDSVYSPASYFEADEDASVRPLPPSSPPSPSPSRSSSSYLSHSRTFRSMAASTKPTTLLSVDLTGGMAHIAQAPPTPTTQGHRIPPHIRTHSSGPSSGSITFSAIPPPSPTSASRPSSGNSGARGATLTAPLYTTHHPRNNPRPSSPPPDDASVLTLASSAFGLPGARLGATAVMLSGRGSIADDSVSQWSNAAGLTDSTSHFMMNDLEEGLEEERYHYHDVDASVRALRPRSSRRGSWDSTVSGWSANVALNSVAGAPSPGGIRSKGLWRSGSLRTGGLSTENEEALEDGFTGIPDDEQNSNDASDPQTKDYASQASSTQEGPDGGTTATEEASSSTQAAALVPLVVPREAPPMLTVSGTRTAKPDDMASTLTLPGSKAVSEVPTPDTASTAEAIKSRTSTPTKAESVAVVEHGKGSEAPKVDEGQVVEVNRLSAQLSPTSTETHSEYHSVPSTPAAL
ncbi:hypothetical protein C8Q79DRAFT_941886 [Trametes meyenii]|nr:hypothetical protein C8Q79DRAFT_941886 [Trametes meyenii]